MKKYIKGFLMAISMFTIIPLPFYKWDEEGAKNILKFYPIIGLIIGLLWYGVFKLTYILDLPLMLKAALTMVFPFIITGMLHLDGYMDVCDALLSRRDKKEKIRILKDPNTGAFSVIALALLFILQFASIYTIVEKYNNPLMLILIPIMSRGLMGFMLLHKESMKESSLGAYFKNGTSIIDKILVLASVFLASIISILILDIKGAIISLAIILSAVIFVNNSTKQLGGMSGDSAGYGLVISEFIGMFFLAIL
ncbi:adenosylcobinamide-GDP ribazoletransferase [Clostridium carnis]